MPYNGCTDKLRKPIAQQEAALAALLLDLCEMMERNSDLRERFDGHVAEDLLSEFYRN